MQYFKDRAEAGRELTKRLERYKDSLSVVIALSIGGVEVGKEIAARLHLPMGMLAVQEVRLPWQQGPLMGTVDQSGEFTKNPFMMESVLDAYEGEYHSYIDQERLRVTHEINMMHVSNIMKRDRLKNHTIILVSDGIKDTIPIMEATEYLKPVRTARVVIAVPVATIDAIDYMHIKLDEIHCLDVKDNYVSTDHYYEETEAPVYEDMLMTLTSFDTMA